MKRLFRNREFTFAYPDAVAEFHSTSNEPRDRIDVYSDKVRHDN